MARLYWIRTSDKQGHESLTVTQRKDQYTNMLRRVGNDTGVKLVDKGMTKKSYISKTIK